jgi:hypothetical protein
MNELAEFGDRLIGEDFFMFEIPDASTPKDIGDLLIANMIKNFNNPHWAQHVFLLRNATFWTPPKHGGKPRGNRYCFWNAMDKAYRDQWCLRYVEGLMVLVTEDDDQLFGAAIPHAWNVKKDGIVVDRTAPDPTNSVYFGLCFPAHDFSEYAQYGYGGELFTPIKQHRRAANALDPQWAEWVEGGCQKGGISLERVTPVNRHQQH